MVRASVTELDFSTHGDEQLALGLDVADVRNIFKDDGFVGKNRGRHRRKSCVLGAADANGPEQRIAAADNKLVHWVRLLPFQTGCACQHYYMRVFGAGSAER